MNAKTARNQKKNEYLGKHLPKKERVKRRRSEEATIICTEKEYEWMTILWPFVVGISP